MGIFTISGLIWLGVGILLILWAIVTYNNFIRLKTLVDEGWSGIDVQLKRRYDLIPNLVAVVKQYTIHEKGVLEDVTKMRSISMGAKSRDEKVAAEQGLTAALKSLFAVAEKYPDLKANENFLSLQSELASLETEIQLARRYYNGASRNYNASVMSFPASIVAKLFGFVTVVYFEINREERELPKITF
jgi:LemA protein